MIKERKRGKMRERWKERRKTLAISKGERERKKRLRGRKGK